MFKPILDNVLIEDLEENKMSKGGIHLTDLEQKRHLQGKVVATGPGLRDDNGEIIPMQVQVGDKIAYEPYMAKEIRLEGKTYWVVKERNIVCVW